MIPGIIAQFIKLTPVIDDGTFVYLHDSFSVGGQLNLRNPTPVPGNGQWKTDEYALQPNIVNGGLVFGEDGGSATLNTGATVASDTVFKLDIAATKLNQFDSNIVVNFYFGYDPGENGPPDFFTSQAVITNDANNSSNWIITFNAYDTYVVSVPGLIDPQGKLEVSIVFYPYIGENTSDYRVYIKSNNLRLPVSLHGDAARLQPIIGNGSYPFNLFRIEYSGLNTSIDYIKLTSDVAVVSDPYFENVKLLMNMDGNSIDVCGKTMLSVGTVNYVTGRFSQSVNLQTGDSGYVNELISDPDFSFGLNDFTVETWVKLNANLPGDGVIVSHFDVIPVNGWQLYVKSNGRPVFFRWVNNGGREPMNIEGVDLRDGQWHHLALVRFNNAMRLYIDGIVPIGASVADAFNYGSTGIKLSVGYQAQGAARYPFRGLIDGMRITKGIALYTTNFIPPDEFLP